MLMSSWTMSLFLVFLSTLCFSQRAQHIMLAAHADLIKSNNDGFFEKVQMGVEGSFYFSRKFAVTGGVDWWSSDKAFVLLGARVCPIDEAFVRTRYGLVNEGFSLGGGFSKPLIENLRIEAMADYYFEGNIAIRAGLSYGIGKTP